MQPSVESQPPSSPPGWYPAEAGVMRWWDGTQWTSPAAPSNADAQRKLLIVGGLIGAIFGLFLSMQSVSLFTGTSKVWTGAAVAVAAFVLVLVMLRKTALWVVITVGVIAALAVSSATYAEVQLQKKRDEFSRMFDE